MFHRVHFISAATATIAVLILLLTVLSPSPSLYGVAYAQANSGPTFDDDAPTTRKVEETPWYRTTDYPPFMENNNRDAGAPVEATDTDSGDTLTYSLDGTDAVYFKIDESSGQIRTKEPLDYENDPAEYTVTVSVHDGKDSSGGPDETIDATITVTITLTNVNEPPKPTREEGEPQPDYDGDMEFTILENTTGPMVFFLKDPEGRGEGWLISGLASDIDSNLFDYEEDVGPTNEQQILFKEKPDYENPEDANKDNVYTFTIMLYDTYRGENGKVAQTFPNIKVRVTDVEESNENPEFAEEDTTRSIAETAAPGASVGDPVAADDLDNDTLTYTLGGDDAASFDIDASSGQLKTKDALDYETKSSYTITVSVSDGKNLENSADDEIDDTITITIDVTDVNEPPQFAAEAPVELTVAENTAVDTNIGEPIGATDDDDGDTLIYSLSETDTEIFDIDTFTGQIKTKAELDFETTPSYTVTVSVSDGDGGTDTITVTITVTEVNEPPVFADDARTALEVTENTAPNENIGNPYTATDPESDTPLTYSLGGTDAASFAIDDSTGQLKTKVGLDYETKISYTVEVQVTDGVDADGNTDTTVDDTHTVAITVTNVDENGSITFSSDPPTVGTALTATVADPDGGVTGETWEWEISDDQSIWNPFIGADTNTYTPIAGDLNKYLRATAQYTDAEGSDKTAQKETGAVADAPHTNLQPDFAETTDTRSVAENTAAGQNIGEPVAAPDDSDGTLVYSLGGTDAASFDIDTSTGQLETKGDLDHETKDTYTVTVSVTDGLDEYSKADTAEEDDDSITVTINVTDVNEPPVFADDARTALEVTENTAPNENIGSPYIATDPDNGDTVTYSLDNGDGAAFEIDSSGQIKTKDPLDRETKSSYSVTVTATDSESATDTHRVTITVTDEEHEPPRFDEEYGDGEASLAREVAENTAAGQPVGAPVSATDDGGDTLTYSLVGTDATSFDIDTTTGQIKTKDPLDYEDTQSYSVTVSVTDSKDSAGNTENTPAEDASIDVTINVTDVNEGPAFADDAPTTLSVDENTATNTDITDGRFTANDPESDTPTYSLSGTDAASFDIDTSTGELKTKADLDHEAKDSYSVTIQVTDGKAADGTTEGTATIDDIHNVTITVTDVDEDGTITFSLDPPSVGTKLTATLTDDDGVKTSPAVTWVWESSPNGTGTWTVISGETTGSYTPGTDDVDDYLRVKATYDDEEGSGKTAEKVSQKVLTAQPTNLQPSFTDASTTRSVPENTRASQNIGAPVSATHSDSVGRLVYSLGGTDAASFDIVASTGQLKTKTIFDYETDTKTSYTVTVSVSDGMDDYSNTDTVVDDTISVTISVTDVNEGPDVQYWSGYVPGGRGEHRRLRPF